MFLVTTIGIWVTLSKISTSHMKKETHQKVIANKISFNYQIIYKTFLHHILHSKTKHSKPELWNDNVNALSSFSFLRWQSFCVVNALKGLGSIDNDVAHEIHYNSFVHFEYQLANFICCKWLVKRHYCASIVFRLDRLIVCTLCKIKWISFHITLVVSINNQLFIFIVKEHVIYIKTCKTFIITLFTIR